MALRSAVMRWILDDRLYRRFFWAWFTVTLAATTACLGGNRALPEFVLSLLLLIMAVIWSLRVNWTGEAVHLGPRTPHLIAAGLLIWTAVYIVPLNQDTAARISGWSAWGQSLNRDIADATGLIDPSPTATLSIDPASSRQDLRRLGAYYLFFLMSLAHLSRWRDLYTMLGIITAVAVAEAVVGSAGVMTGSRRFLWLLPNPVSQDHRLFGTFVNPNHAGSLLAVGLTMWIPLALVPVALQARRADGTRLGKLRSILLALAGAILIVGLFLTGSHGAMLAAGLPVTVVLSWLALRLPQCRRFVGATAALALSVGLVAYSLLPAAERDRHAEKIAERGRWLADERPLLRRKIWQGAFAAAAVAPITGSGPGTFINAYRPFDLTRKETLINSAHNTYLDLLIERGLVGVAIVGLGIGWLVCTLAPRRSRRPPRSAPGRSAIPTLRPRSVFRICLGGAAAVILLHCAVDFPLQIPAIALVLAALIAAVVRTSPQWASSIRHKRRPTFVPFAAAVAGAVLVATSHGPLAASGHLGRIVRLNEQIEKQLSERTEPGGQTCKRMLEHAAALHELRFHDSHAAAYALALRMRMLERSDTSAALRRSLLQDAVEMIRDNPFCVDARLAAAATHAAPVLAEQAMQLDPGHAATHYVAGRAFLTAGEEHRALIAFARSLNTSPRFVFDIARSVHDHDLAEQMLGLPIHDPRSLCWLAMCLAETDDATKRRVAAGLHVALEDRDNPLTSAERLYLHGQTALWLQNRPEEAVNYFEASLTLEPLLWIRWHLAQAYHRGGRSVDAAAELEAIAEVDHDYLPFEIQFLPGESTRSVTPGQP